MCYKVRSYVLPKLAEYAMKLVNYLLFEWSYVLPRAVICAAALVICVSTKIFNERIYIKETLSQSLMNI